MASSTPQQRLLALYLALPIPRQESFWASLSTQEQGELAETLATYKERRSITNATEDLARRDLAPNNGLQKTEGATLEHLIDNYKKGIKSEELIFTSELMNHFNPQELSNSSRGSKSKLTIHDLREASQTAVPEISGLHQWLTMLILHCEGLIRSRWRAKSRAQKQVVLLTAWPDMAPSHRPDMAAYIHRDRDEKVGEKYLETVTWPYINLEDLLLPNTLLIFLNTRARHFPSEFAYYDLEMAPRFKKTRLDLDVRNDGFSMAFLGTNSFQDYARWIEWDNANERVESIRTGRTIDIYHGVQILIIQRRILRFLVECATILVGETSLLDELHNAPAPLQELPSLSSNIGGLTLPHIIAREAPYRLPTRLDLARLVSLASAQKHEAIEHAWALREDPSYFAEAVEQVQNHRGEFIPDAHGAISRKIAENEKLCPEEMTYVITHNFCMVFNWNHVSNKLKVLQGISVKYAGAIVLNEDLPTDFFNEFAQTRYFLERMSVDLICYLRRYFYASPPVREHLCRDESATSNKKTYGIRARKNPYDKPVDRIGHLLQLSYFFEDQAQRNYLTLHVIMDEFERFMQSDAQSKALISPLIATLISQLAIVAECLHHLHSFQPWARHVESEIEQNRSTKFTTQFDALLQPWSRINTAHELTPNEEMFRLAAARDGRFHYPAHERRTSSVVRKMRSAEAALDKFWDAADAFWLRKTGNTPGSLIKDLLGGRELYRTPVWTQPQKTLRTTRNLTENVDSVVPFSGHIHDRSKEVTGTFTKQPATIKTKQKTQGATEVKVEAVTATLEIASSTAYIVDKRALKVFRNLFRSPDSPDQVGQIVWSDFLHAMVSVGFAAEKLQGSAWHFTPSTSAAERSIQFHEPHPANRLPVTWARRYGRRLTRAFGWTSSSFKLA
ncbi:hypothetical protein E8E13_010233 [Curvularia kusanoi]|uniref:Uncharacterized protein n=1 Tax=Curvularia kusanoi TaxID=90978 RepID=A0A9P4WEI3_CURKU|nr:hypothetical protein E8E13_010233 [Curvularia kusanoi]